MKSFSELNLIKPIMRALADENYEKPTPIQAQAIPPLLAGHDLLGCAQTGTGKTAAFSLPILQKLADGKGRGPKGTPRALILTPTRELANQINESFRTYGKHLRVSHTAVYGGVSISGQARALSRGVDVLVATPGRLLDLMQQGLVFLDQVEVFTLDEADRMLDMGFIHDIKRVIAKLPAKRQTLFFSATMPKTAHELANDILRDPIHVKVNPVSSTAEKIEQKVFFVDKGNKEALLLELLENPEIFRALVFTRTKHKANNVAKKLNKHRVTAEAIHGNKSQAARMRALKSFSDGRARVLVATDVASRGIDIEGVTHVINFEMPDEPENYVHRIGRTARAGASGAALSFCDIEEKYILNSIERVTRAAMPIELAHPYHCEVTANSRAGRPPQRGGYNKQRPYHQRQQRGRRGGYGSRQARASY